MARVTPSRHGGASSAPFTTGGAESPGEFECRVLQSTAQSQLPAALRTSDSSTEARVNQPVPELA